MFLIKRICLELALLIIMIYLSKLIKTSNANRLVNLKGDNVCCQQNMPLKPTFDHNGNLVGYETQECPQQYLVCCKGYIGLYGVCLSLDNAFRWLKFNQDYSNRYGIELNLAILENEQDWCCSHAQSQLDFLSQCVPYYYKCCVSRPNTIEKMNRDCLSLNFAQMDYFGYYQENVDSIYQNAIENFG